MQDQLSRTKITLKCEVIRAMLCLSLQSPKLYILNKEEGKHSTFRGAAWTEGCLHSQGRESWSGNFGVCAGGLGQVGSMQLGGEESSGEKDHTGGTKRGDSVLLSFYQGSFPWEVSVIHTPILCKIGQSFSPITSILEPSPCPFILRNTQI